MYVEKPPSLHHKDLPTFSENNHKETLLAHKESEQPGWKGTVLPPTQSLTAGLVPHPPRLCLMGVTPLRGSKCLVELEGDFCHMETFHRRASFDKGLLLIEEGEAGAHLVSCWYVTTTRNDRQNKHPNHNIQQAGSSLEGGHGGWRKNRLNKYICLVGILPLELFAANSCL